MFQLNVSINVIVSVSTKFKLNSLYSKQTQQSIAGGVCVCVGGGGGGHNGS